MKSGFTNCQYDPKKSQILPECLKKCSWHCIRQLMKWWASRSSKDHLESSWWNTRVQLLRWEDINKILHYMLCGYASDSNLLYWQPEDIGENIENYCYLHSIFRFLIGTRKSVSSVAAQFYAWRNFTHHATLAEEKVEVISGDAASIQLVMRMQFNLSWMQFNLSWMQFFRCDWVS